MICLGEFQQLVVLRFGLPQRYCMSHKKSSISLVILACLPIHRHFKFSHLLFWLVGVWSDWCHFQGGRAERAVSSPSPCHMNELRPVNLNSCRWGWNVHLPPGQFEFLLPTLKHQAGQIVRQVDSPRLEVKSGQRGNDTPNTILLPNLNWKSS